MDELMKRVNQIVTFLKEEIGKMSVNDVQMRIVPEGLSVGVISCPDIHVKLVKNDKVLVDLILVPIGNDFTVDCFVLGGPYHSHSFENSKTEILSKIKDVLLK